MIRLDNIQYVGITVEEEFANSTKAESEDSKIQIFRSLGIHKATLIPGPLAKKGNTPKPRSPNRITNNQQPTTNNNTPASLFLIHQAQEPWHP